MNSPFMGNFKVTQTQHANHDGLDLVGLDSKEIHSTVAGVVEVAGWENSKNQKQGFGLYVRIKKDGSSDRYYFGHLSELKVKKGDTVKITDVIGIEGSTGNSTGSHLHYCVRGDASKSQVRDVSAISGIPNAIGTYNDGYVPSPSKLPDKPASKSGVTKLKPGNWNVRKAPSMGAAVARVVTGQQSVTYVDIVPETNPAKYGDRDFYKLRDGNYISVKACK